MKDWAKFLYDLHCHNLSQVDPRFKEFLISWDELPAEGKRVWDMTAQGFIKEYNS